MTAFVVVRAHDSGRGLGVAHARATIHLRDQIADRVRRAVAENPLSNPTVARRLRAVESVLDRHSPDTLEQVAGMGSVLELPVDELLLAVLGTYLASAEGSASGSRRERRPDTGCSTFALTGLPEHGLGPVLCKNRDTDRSSLHLQTLLHVRPSGRHPWAALSTAGAPDVHSSGMNSEGLAVVDTHVPSTDVGPGLPRFVAMRRILEDCASTAEALELLRSVPLMGLGNLVLADPSGDIAVVECGHAEIGVVRPVHDYVVATNHYVSPQLTPSNLPSPQSRYGADSRQRRAWLTHALEQIDPAAVRSDPARLLAHHGSDGSASVCVQVDEGSATISTVVFRPASETFEALYGTPCNGVLSPVPIKTTR
jgi:predicted choloylglycine hydrolase